MNFESIISALESGATVLTANNRLARRFKRRFDEKQQAKGATVWPSAEVLPLESWLHFLFEEYQAVDENMPVLLNGAQQQLLWEQIIDHSKQQKLVFLNVAATAAQTQAAWSIAIAYNFDFSNPSELRSADQEQFVAWALEYKRQCQKQGFIDNSMLMDVLANNIANDASLLGKQLILTGFYELTPQQQRFVQGLRDSGINVVVVDSVPDVQSSPVRVPAQDDTTELQMAARWARNQLEENPDANIAIVVSDIQTRKATFEYVFNQCFFPGLNPAELQKQAEVWNISLGSPLALMPVVETAMLFLQLLGNGLSSEELTRLLLSPHLKGGDSELSRRAMLDAREHVRKHEQIDLTKLLTVTEGKTGSLNRALTKVKSKLDKKPKSPSGWAKNFAELLKAVGWPGEGTLGSLEYQQVEQFRDVVSALSAYDGLINKTSFTVALAELRKLVQQTVFKPKAAEAPIQVLGLLEVTGLVFDAVWVCSMDNLKWPQTSTPNPYLPLAWQKQVAAPHASAMREYDYANYLLKQLKHSAKTVVFSHVEKRDDNELKCANMIADIAEQNFSGLVPDGKSLPIPSLESLQDDFGAAVLDDQHIRGGSGLFASQAECPFKAFVTYRLDTRELERPKPGVDARDRGNLIHQLLEAFWKEVEDQETLLAMSDAELMAKIVSLAENRLTEINGGTGLARLNDLETQRAIRIVREWLELEKEREPFRVVSLEVKEEIKFEGIDINLQIDRIDAISNNGGEDLSAIFDYKTSSHLNPKTWIDDRPSAPQLPIYALSRDVFPDAVCYVQLSGTENRFLGYAVTDEFLPGVDLPSIGRKKTDVLTWEETKTKWQTNLHALAAEIKSGCASVTPKKGACDYCELKPVCRVDDFDGEEE